MGRTCTAVFSPPRHNGGNMRDQMHRLAAFGAKQRFWDHHSDTPSVQAGARRISATDAYNKVASDPVQLRGTRGVPVNLGHLQKQLGDSGYGRALPDLSGRGGDIYGSSLRLPPQAAPCLSTLRAKPDNQDHAGLLHVRTANDDESHLLSRHPDRFRRQRLGRTFQSSGDHRWQKPAGPTKPPKRRQWRFSA